MYVCIINIPNREVTMYLISPTGLKILMIMLCCTSHGMRHFVYTCMFIELSDYAQK